MKALPLPSLKVLLSLRFNRYYGQLRFPCRPSEISSPYIHSLPSCIASARASRAIPHDLPCVSPLLPREFICRFWQFSSGQMSQPSPNVHRVGNSIFHYEATYRFACAATRRFAQPTEWAFVKELRVLGYPSHLLQATWANCRIPMVGL